MTASLALDQPFAIFRPDERCLVRLWMTSLDDDRDALAACMAHLSEDERSRADRFHNQLHRLRFIRSRSALRSLLSEQLHINPREIRFTCGEFGKPMLANPVDQPLHFNISHSGGVMIVAIADQPIGVDIEEVRELDDLFALAKRVFSREIVQEIAGLSAPARKHRFFQHWTLQEARLKAHGLGLGALDNPAAVAQALATPAWSVSIDEPGDFIAAVAVRDLTL